YLWRLAMADPATRAAQTAADQHTPTTREHRVIEAGTEDLPTSSGD
ncbi:MAG: hypothetical protein QOK10_723, partial [Pseudonocardiales bacterium]|nr:hypothetical protein [Pseudonocardiales bacterium]